MSSFIVFHMASPCGFQMTMPIPNFFWEKPNNIEKLSLLFREGEKQTLVLKMIHSLFKSLLWHKNAEMSKRGQVSYRLVYKIYKIYWGLSSFFVLFCLIVLYFVLAENHTWRFSGMIPDCPQWLLLVGLELHIRCCRLYLCWAYARDMIYLLYSSPIISSYNLRITLLDE